MGIICKRENIFYVNTEIHNEMTIAGKISYCKHYNEKKNVIIITTQALGEPSGKS